MARTDKEEWFANMMDLPKAFLVYFLDKANNRAKRAEALKPSHNSRYVTALDVLQEYGGVTDVQYQDEHSFEVWLTERLNAEEPHCT